VDEERRRWLEKLAEACERVAADDAERALDSNHAALIVDAEALLGRIRSELGDSPR